MEEGEAKDEEHEPMIMIPAWKLYENPFYIHTHNHGTLPDPPINNKPGDGQNDDHLCFLRKFVKDLMEPELDDLRSKVDEMRARIEHERKTRKKAEWLNEKLSRELVNERGAREALERLCERLAREVSSGREGMERMQREIEEERRMLHMAEVLREERVQMKLAEARAVLEERIGRLEARTAGEAKVNGSREKSTAREERLMAAEEKGSGEKAEACGLIENGNCCEGRGGGGAGGVRGAGTGRRPSPEAKNPHIMRGIRGFVEFPKGIRGVGSRSRNGRNWGAAKVEYQKDQIRILLKQRSPVKCSDVAWS